MKKILIVFIILLSLFVIPNFKVEALEDSFHSAEYIPGAYIKKFKGSSGKYEQMRFFRRNSDNQPVYCLETWENLKENTSLTGYDHEQYNYGNLDYSIWERVMKIAYYGYGYGNHTDSKWFAITQFMIWQETSKDSTIYFTDTLNGNKKSKYETEIAEINNLIRNHPTTPSFNNQTFEVNYNTPFTITDTNQVLDKYDVLSNGGLTVEKSGNQLTITKLRKGNSQLSLINKDKKYPSAPIIYVDKTGQDVLAPGNYYAIYAAVNYTLKPATLVINKLDFDTKTTTSQGESKLYGSKFQLLDKNRQVILEQEMGEDLTLTFSDLDYDTYYLKETVPGEGYQLNSEVVQIQMDEERKTLDFYNQVIKNQITFQKYLKNPITGELKKEANAKFSIYNQKKEKVTTFETDKKGSYTITLPYGTYRVVQEAGAKNHQLIEDFTFQVTQEGQKQTFPLYNEQLTVKVRVKNTDFDSNLPILEQGATFQIKNLDTNEYLTDIDGEKIIFTTNNLGITEMYLLASGNYQVEQINAVDTYQVNNNSFPFIITEEADFLEDENHQKYLEIIVPNKKIKSRIEIEKWTEYYFNDIFKEKKQNIDLEIPIYAKEDIYSKDGVKLYEKDQIVSTALWNGETILTDDLYLGTFYLVNPIDESIIEVILDSEKTKKVELLEQVFEYSKEQEQEQIDVPNTITKKTNVSYLGTIFLFSGFILYQKGKKNEN